MPFQITRAGALRLIAGFAALVAFGPALPSHAAAYPDHPITLVVPSRLAARATCSRASSVRRWANCSTCRW